MSAKKTLQHNPSSLFHGYVCSHLTGFFLTESYLYSFVCFHISLQFLLVTFLKGFCLIAQEGFGSLFVKDTG